MFEVILILSLSLTPGSPLAAVQGPDPEDAARSAAYRYENLLRRRAPERYGGGSGPCDEIVGRFCFRFGSDIRHPPAEPEHPEVVQYRQLAIRAHRRWLSLEPENGKAAGGLIRYLVEDRRPREAVPLARAHVAMAGTPGSFLLLGMALHYTGDFAAAETAFDSARALVTPEERQRLDDVEMLLDPGERSLYRRLGPAEKTAYNRRFWALADPSLLIPGNERRSAHYARQAWIQILSEAPRAAGMLSWGHDHAEIVLRYGVPRSRERIESTVWHPRPDLRMVEYFDPRAVSFVPGALVTEGVPYQPVPGARPALERDTTRSAYAPIHHRRTRGLETQVTRLPASTGWVLRVDAVLPPDTAAPTVPVAPRGLLVVLDTLGVEISRTVARVEHRADSATVVRAESPVPAGTHIYQIELVDDSTDLAGWSRHRIDVADGVLVLSDPLIARPPADSVTFARSDLRPWPSRVLAPDQKVFVYAQARGLLRVGGDARYAVEWWLERRERGSLLGRAFRWVGRNLGLVEESSPVRLRWEAAEDERGPVAITFALDLAGARPGHYRLGLTVRDRVSGREATSYRELLLDAQAARFDVRDRD